MVLCVLVDSLEDRLGELPVPPADESTWLLSLFFQQLPEDTKRSVALAFCDAVWAHCESELSCKLRSTPSLASLAKAQPVTGAVGVPSGPLLGEPYTLVWRTTGSVVYTIACAEHESVASAVQLLSVLPQVIGEQLRSAAAAGEPRQLMQNLDEVQMIVQRLLPCGVLSPMSISLSRQLRAQIEHRMRAPAGPAASR